MYRSINPATEELLDEFPEFSASQSELVLTKAEKAFSSWRNESFRRRAEFFVNLSKLLESRAEHYATLIALEMGKPLADGIGEVKKCAQGCRYFAEHAEEALAPEVSQLEEEKLSLLYHPMGPLLAIMPWNYPFWQLFRFAAPAVMAGNVVVLKHAPNVPQCALAIEQGFRDAGFPDGVLQTIFLENEAALGMIADRRIRGVTLTGSPRAGREVASAAGKALKPVVLELGGSDPFIVLPDANLEKVVNAAIIAKNTNNGQVCIAAKRFLIHQDLYPDFVERFCGRMKERRLGDPLLPETENGPMARGDLKQGLADQVARSLAAGARIIAEGTAPEGRGHFYAPTVLENVQPGSPAYDEELFGPVAAVFPFHSTDDAIRLANDTVYGLGATVWTEDRTAAEAFAPQIEAGQIFVNGVVRSDPRVPFGGMKDSGFGRELGTQGVRTFTNQKTLIIK